MKGDERRTTQHGDRRQPAQGRALARSAGIGSPSGRGPPSPLPLQGAHGAEATGGGGEGGEEGGTGGGGHAGAPPPSSRRRAAQLGGRRCMAAVDWPPQEEEEEEETSPRRSSPSTSSSLSAMLGSTTDTCTCVCLGSLPAARPWNLDIIFRANSGYTLMRQSRWLYERITHIFQHADGPRILIRKTFLVTRPEAHGRELPIRAGVGWRRRLGLVPRCLAAPKKLHLTVPGQTRARCSAV